MPSPRGLVSAHLAGGGLPWLRGVVGVCAFGENIQKIPYRLALPAIIRAGNVVTVRVAGAACEGEISASRFGPGGGIVMDMTNRPSRSRLAAAEQILRCRRRPMTDMLYEALNNGWLEVAAAIMGSGVDLDYQSSLGMTLIEAAVSSRHSGSLPLIRRVLKVDQACSLEGMLQNSELREIAQTVAMKDEGARAWAMCVEVAAANLKAPGRVTTPMRVILWEMVSFMENQFRMRQQQEGGACVALGESTLN